MPSQRKRVEVAVVGCGPVGLTLANLLGMYGVRTVALERKRATVDEPRAIAIDAEALRTLQAAGLYDAVAPDMVLGFRADYVNAAGTRLAEMDLGPTPYGHAQQNAFDQPRLERQLHAGLARFPHVEARFGHTVQRVRQSAKGVTLHGVDGDGRDFDLEADYVVGCDGGRSTVRQHLGIEMRGHTAPQRWLVIDTVDPTLADRLDCRFFCDPARPGMTLRKQHRQRRWEWMLLPGESDDDLLDDGVIRRLIAPYTNPDKVRLERKCIYVFHSIVADRYRDRRILIAGDAAHMMPPFAGQGMNGGIRDARNLAWKLHAILRGAAAPALLDSYQVERRAHVIAATELANRLGSIIQPTSRLAAAARDAVFAAVNLTSAGQELFRRLALRSLVTPELPAGTFVPFPTGWFDAAPLAGQFVPQPHVRAVTGDVPFDDTLGPGFAVVGYDDDPVTVLDDRSAAYWQRLGARFVHVVRRRRKSAPDAVEDRSGALAAWFGTHRARCVAVRPDRFCVAQFDAEGAAVATRGVERLLHGAPDGT